MVADAIGVSRRDFRKFVMFDTVGDALYRVADSNLSTAITAPACCLAPQSQCCSNPDRGSGCSGTYRLAAHSKWPVVVKIIRIPLRVLQVGY